MSTTVCLRPHGRSGLKWDRRHGWLAGIPSPPTRAEWIEIGLLPDGSDEVRQSPPTRAEWIEIFYKTDDDTEKQVSAHTGGVD